MKVLIIEDELPAAARLKALIQEYDSRITIEGPLENNQAVIEWFENHEAPDLIFSDIELLDGPVFHAFTEINPKSPIIFTTAYHQYILDAFQSNGIAYLLKPFEKKAFYQAIDKFDRLKQNFLDKGNQTIIAEIKTLYTQKQKPSYKSRLTIKKNQEIYLIEVKDIICIRTEHKVPYAFLLNGKKHPLSDLLSELQHQLNPAQFYRINRSEIINVSFIEKIEPYFNDRLAIKILGQKHSLVTSAAKTKEFRNWLKQL